MTWFGGYVQTFGSKPARISFLSIIVKLRIYHGYQIKNHMIVNLWFRVLILRHCSNQFYCLPQLLHTTDPNQMTFPCLLSSTPAFPWHHIPDEKQTPMPYMRPRDPEPAPDTSVQPLLYFLLSCWMNKLHLWPNQEININFRSIRARCSLWPGFCDPVWRCRQIDLWRSHCWKANITTRNRVQSISAAAPLTLTLTATELQLEAPWENIGFNNS